jgi:hypothetical protein
MPYNKIFKEYSKTARVTYISKIRNFIGPWKNKTDVCCNTSDVMPTMSIHIYIYSYGIKNLSLLHNFIQILFQYILWQILKRTEIITLYARMFQWTVLDFKKIWWRLVNKAKTSNLICLVQDCFLIQHLNKTQWGWITLKNVGYYPPDYTISWSTLQDWQKNLKFQIQSIHLRGNITHTYKKLQTFLTVVSNVTPCNA